MSGSLEFKCTAFNQVEEDNVDLEEDGGKQFRRCVDIGLTVQIYGKTQDGRTCVVFATGYRPHFYVKVADYWTNSVRTGFVAMISSQMGSYYEDSIVSSCLVRHKCLYGFNAGSKGKFIKMVFANERAFKKASRLWYKDGMLTKLKYKDYATELYEAKLPPMIKMMHDLKIRPSGWISIKKSNLSPSGERTTCQVSVRTNWKNIVPLLKEDAVPYKTMSYDIEASSSHGDFPVAIKTYRKLAEDYALGCYKTDQLGSVLSTAFQLEGGSYKDINVVYPKEVEVCEKDIEKWCAQIMKTRVVTDDEDLAKYNGTTLSAIDTMDIKHAERVGLITTVFDRCLPKLEGDKVTFIGSTFMRYGESDPYRKTIIALGECADIPGAEVISCGSEKEVLLKWSSLVQQEDPDIVLGYNTMGFDDSFLYERSLELECSHSFLKVSRLRNEQCIERNWSDETEDIASSSITLASGQYDLRYIRMPGRVQVDLYNFFRKEYNLGSYKLDSVAGTFIGDCVTNKVEQDGQTQISSNNLSGLAVGSFVTFEHGKNAKVPVENGRKFQVVAITTSGFTVTGSVECDLSSGIRWGLAKDDVSPQDIFRLTNEGASEKAIVGKYCIADCDILH